MGKETGEGGGEWGGTSAERSCPEIYVFELRNILRKLLQLFWTCWALSYRTPNVSKSIGIISRISLHKIYSWEINL